MAEACEICSYREKLRQQLIQAEAMASVEKCLDRYQKQKGALVSCNLPSELAIKEMVRLGYRLEPIYSPDQYLIRSKESTP